MNAVEMIAEGLWLADGYDLNGVTSTPDPETVAELRPVYMAQATVLADRLTAAGLLATEREWGIRTEGGTVLDGARDRAYAEKWAAGCTHTNGLTGEVRTGTAVAVSRGVTAWREQA